jgi:phosphoribosylanthranilate isomerase
MNKPFIKICGITSVDDAKIAVECGASAIGLNFFNQSKRFISIEKAKKIADSVRREVTIVGVFVDHDQKTISEIEKSVGLDYVQLHGNESPEFTHQFPNAIKAFRMKSKDDIERLSKFDAPIKLLDSFHENIYGGTGKTFDWSLAIHAATQHKIIIAGGLTPDNVHDAILEIHPFGVDVSSGVESEPRKKDRFKVEQYINNARNAFEFISVKV